MNRRQFRALYRESLFRIVDLELLSAHAQGDLSRLFGQFAALLLFLSILFSLPALGFDLTGAPPLDRLLVSLSAEHFLISTTMLVVGLFAVLSWDSTFPDRRDVLILGPLPVRPGMLFLARIAAVATSLGLTIGLVHLPAGIFWPLSLNNRAQPQQVPSMTFAPAMAPMGAANLEPVLRRELAGAQGPGGPLAAGTGAGMVVGVVKNGARRVIAFGTARPDSLFEIGSITKTFTGLLLARMCEQGTAHLDQPVRELLPEGTVTKPRGREITLLDLATHRSGLRVMPGNLNREDPDNPYAQYRASDLYEYLRRRGVAKPIETQFLYSNLGFGLLGVALANRAGVSWPELTERVISGPLGMEDTVVSLSPAQQARFIQGRDLKHRGVHAWDLADGLAGAGALRSTANDMLTYLEANLHPEKTTPDAGLRRALLASHELKNEVGSRSRIALAWFYGLDSGAYYHSGGTGGYSSYASFSPKGDYAAIVLYNSSPALPLADLVGMHVQQRLAGEPALSLALISTPPSGSLPRLVRMYLAYWVTMLAAGAFLFCCVLMVQGAISQALPRALSLRASSFVQMGAFSLFISVYFLQPMLATPDAIMKAQSGGLLAWSPSYWFLGLFQALNGSEALRPLARRALIGLAVAGSGAAAFYALSYFRTLRRIVEEPDIAPIARGGWLPRFGTSFESAVTRFSVRTLMRSKRHRMILAFYLGVGLAITIFLVKSPSAHLVPDAGVWQRLAEPLFAASIVIAGCSVIGARAVMSLPLELRANWIFRTAPLPLGRELFAAGRRALYALSVVPVCAASAVLFCWIAPWRVAAEHLIILFLFAALLAELSIGTVAKMPFACSYLPGKSNVHTAFWLCVAFVLALIRKGAALERQILESPRRFALLVFGMAILVFLARLRTGLAVGRRHAELRFEDRDEDEVLVLGLEGER